MIYAAPGTEGAKIAYKAQYDNFIGGKWTPPVEASTSTSSADQRQRSTPRPHAPAQPTSSSRSTPPMPQPTPGARPADRARQHPAQDR